MAGVIDAQREPWRTGGFARTPLASEAYDRSIEPPASAGPGQWQHAWIGLACPDCRGRLGRHLFDSWDGKDWRYFGTSLDARLVALADGTYGRPGSGDIRDRELVLDALVRPIVAHCWTRTCNKRRVSLRFIPMDDGPPSAVD